MGRWLAPAALPPRKSPGTRCIRGWVGPRTGLDRRENIASTGIRSPDRPARSESLYRLSYSGIQDCHGKSSIWHGKDSAHQQIGLQFKEETCKVLHSEHNIVWCSNFDTSKVDQKYIESF